MLIVQVNQQFQIVETINSHAAFPVAIEVQPDSKVESLVTDLTSNPPWGNWKNAAHPLSSLWDLKILPVLFVALVVDPFWMVRCGLI